MTHLVNIFLTRLAELKVYDNHLFPVGHNAVGKTFQHLTAIFVNGKNGTLVKELPTVAEPVGDSRMGKSFLQHGSNALGRKLFVVENTFEFQLTQDAVNIVSGTNVGKEVVQDITYFNI